MRTAAAVAVLALTALLAACGSSSMAPPASSTYYPPMDKAVTDLGVGWRNAPRNRVTGEQG